MAGGGRPVDRARLPPADLSGGQKQRVAIAGLWPAGRPSCWPTNRPGTSTTTLASRSWIYSATGPDATIGLC